MKRFLFLVALLGFLKLPAHGGNDATPAADLDIAQLEITDVATVEVATVATVALVAISTRMAEHALKAQSLAGVARTLGLGSEEYVYRISWGALKVGRSTLGAPDAVTIDGKPAYHIVSTARTSSFFDAFHKVRDSNEAWLDSTNFISRGFGKHLKEGKFFREEIVVFDHEAGAYSATVKNKKGEVKKEAGTMKPYSYDVLSALYWVRAQDLVVGKEYSIDVNTRKDWPLMIRVKGTKKVKVPAGEFDCLVIEPMMRDEGIFVQKGKSMDIWLTNDARKIPVKVQAEVFIGSVKAELEEIVYKQ